MKKRFLPPLLALLLACCLLLSGCGEPKNETLDGQLAAVLDALNTDNGDAFVALIYPSENIEEDARELFEQFRTVWTPMEPEDAELVTYTVSSGGDEKVYEGIYRLPRDDEYSHMQIQYVETPKGSGITALYMGTMAKGQETAQRLSSNKILQWGWYLLNLGFIVVTIVDIVRKKPSKYGLYIVMALVFFNLRIAVNGFSFALSIPLGSLIYWIIRRKMV